MKILTAYFGLGSNIGRREKLVSEAMKRISSVDGIELISFSSLYETEPWGKTDQPSFINAAMSVKTTLIPEELLDMALAIEASLGRLRREKWGARKIDIDILHIEGIVRDTERLKLPHPYLFERQFVLIPLLEIVPDLIINGKNISEISKNLGDQNIKKIQNHNSVREYETAL